jgi:tight adherence protein B
VAFVRTIVVALIGIAVALAFARLARRFTVADRLRPDAAGRVRELPRVLRDPLTRALADAAVRSRPEHVIQMWVLAAVVAGIVGFGIGPSSGVIGAMAVVVGGPVLLHSSRHRQARRVAASVPDLLERLAAELRAGGTVATGLATVAAGDTALAPDITRVETRVQLGASLGHALQEWASERKAAGVDATAGALALTASVGGRASDALDALASSLRARLAVVAEARALSAQARYSAWVIGVAPLAYMGASAVIDPRSIHALVGTNLGRLCAVAGIVLEVLGAVWMRAITGAGDAA